jgi:hypothetical protein
MMSNLHTELLRHFVSYQYSETNVIHFLFDLLLIKGLYMFRALLAHPQEVLHKQHFVYCVPVTIRTQYTKCRLWSASWEWASNARIMYRPLILNKLNKKCITFVALYWYTMMHVQQNIKFVLETLKWRIRQSAVTKCCSVQSQNFPAGRHGSDCVKFASTGGEDRSSSG